VIIGRKPIGTVAYMGGVPAVLESFCWSLAQLVAFSAHYACENTEFIHLDRSDHSFHSWARNALAERMLGDWLLMLDTDHQFEPDLLARLLHRMNTYDLDVVTAVYQFKRPPHSPVLYGWLKPAGSEGADAGVEPGLVPLAGWGEAGDVMEVAAAGAGSLLVRRRVFERIEAELKERPFDVIGQGGEDLSFFRRLRKLGLKAYVDPRVECHHLQVRPLSLADYDPGDVPLQKVRIADAQGYAPDKPAPAARPGRKRRKGK
jgi:hypothetical protein